MLTIKNFEYDCTRKCRCRQHGNAITAALTKRSIDDDKLAAFIAKTCCNFRDVVDDLGRSAVHQAASVGRYAILEWLLNQGALINKCDFESGSSALHRAVYYGCVDCAVVLLRYGASSEILDENTRTALQDVCRCCDFPERAKVAANNEILAWGCNRNYNLGIGNEEGANMPQSIDFFRKEHISIQCVALGAYHSLFLDKKSNLYAVGHGKGGRLGISVENSLPAPKKVKVPIKNTGEVIIDISVSRKHSLLLTNHSAVFACGLNEDQQLGVRDAGAKLTAFKEVLTLRDLNVEGLIHVIAKDFHSLTYSDRCVYVWGTNHGQMGLNADVKVVPFPKLLKLAADTHIEFVEANNFATAVYNKENLVLLFYNFKVKSLKTPNFEALKGLAIVGGDNTRTAKGSATALKLLVLTQTNVVYLWYEMTQNFYRCIFSQIRISEIDKIFYKANQVLILSQGDVYKGKCNQIAVHSVASSAEADGFQKKGVGSRQAAGTIWSRCDQSNIAISTEHIIRIDLQRLAAIDRAVDIACNDDFSAFAVLQESHMKYFKLPALTPEEYSFKKLYNDVSESDAVHDVVFHVDGEVYAAHKLIIYARAPGMREIIADHADEHVYVNFSYFSGKMFELMLKFIYTNYFPNEDDLNAIRQSLGPDSPAEQREICLLFLDFVEKFQLKDLTSYLRSFLQQNPFYLPDYIDKSKYRFQRLRRKDFPELYDVRIICADGLELAAHKCILVARLEYFDMMFSHSWSENTTVSLSTVPVEYMEPILDFLYSSDIEHFRKQKYSESFLYNMIVFCDQFFIERLRKVCEVLILDKISIRKCGDMLHFASTYNCELLKRGCLEFICQNLARVLAHKSLDSCEPEMLSCINSHYRQMFKEVFDYRIITPDTEAIDDELLLSFVDDFSVDLSYRMEDVDKTSLRKSSESNQKENKSKPSARQYEREAISSMLVSMQLNDETNAKNRVDDGCSKVAEEAKAVAAKLQAESKSWMKVVDKKDQKKKLNVEQMLKANELLKQEEKMKAEFVPLQVNLHVEKTKEANGTKAAIEKDSTPTPDTPSPSAKVYNINLADVTPSREKLSQKQRKRLSLESNRTPSVPLVEPAKPAVVAVAPIPQPNAWGLTAQSSLSAQRSPSPPTGSSADPTSFANMIRDRGATKREHKREQPTASFSKIVAEEKQQRDYYERMRSKSLALTQIEETAIAELRQFYNVDNVDDEIITIERKAVPRTMNFAIWQRN